MLVVNTIEFFPKEFARKRSLIPKEEKRFCSETNNMVDCVYFVNPIYEILFENYLVWKRYFYFSSTFE